MKRPSLSGLLLTAGLALGALTSIAGKAQEFGASHQIRDFALSRDAKLCCVLRETNGFVFDTRSGYTLCDLDLTWSLERSSGIVRGSASRVAFTPDGSRILTAVPYDLRVPAKLWDGASGRLLREFGEDEPSITAVAFSPEATQAAFGMGDCVRCRDAGNGDLIWTSPSLRPEMPREGLHLRGGPSSRIYSVQSSPDGQSLLVGTRDGVFVLNASNGVPVCRLSPELSQYSPIFSLCWSPDGRMIGGAGLMGKLMFWRWPQTNAIQSFTNYRSASAIRAVSVALSPDGTLAVIAGFEERATVIWDLQTWRKLASIGEANSVAFAGDRFVVTSQEDCLKLWNARTGAFIKDLLNQEGHTSAIPER